MPSLPFSQRSPGTHFVMMISLQAYSLKQLTERLLAVIPVILFVPVGAKLRSRIEPHGLEIN